MNNHSDLRDAIKAELSLCIEEAFTYVSTDLGHQDDVIEVMCGLLPDPVDYDGDATEYVEDIVSSLDLDGCVFREGAEDMISDLIYTAEGIEYYQSNREHCMSAVHEIYGDLAGMAAECDTIEDMMFKAAAWGRDSEWSEAVADAAFNMSTALEKWEDLSPMVWG